MTLQGIVSNFNDPDLVPGNIKNLVTILGVTWTLSPTWVSKILSLGNIPCVIRSTIWLLGGYVGESATQYLGIYLKYFWTPSRDVIELEKSTWALSIIKNSAYTGWRTPGQNNLVSAYQDWDVIYLNTSDRQYGAFVDNHFEYTISTNSMSAMMWWHVTTWSLLWSTLSSWWATISFPYEATWWASEYMYEVSIQ